MEAGLTSPSSTSLQFLTEPLRSSIEQFVVRHCGRGWSIKEFKDLNDLSSHPSAILSDGDYSVFVKLSNAANGLEQFEVELAGLQMLSSLAGVLTPTPIGILSVENGIILVTETVESVERTAREWRDIGRTLARIHQVKGDRYGLSVNGYFGPLYQDNRPMNNWLAFYAERRLWPRLMGAINTGHMPTSAIREVEKLIQRLPNLDVPETIPTLLHGDAQQNNFISTKQGAVVIDPAVHYGNPEMDLAYLDYFRPVPDDVLLEYQETMPIDPGFRERRDLWRIYGYLAIVEVEGQSYLDILMDAVRKYL